MICQDGRPNHSPRQFVKGRNCWLPPSRSSGRVKVVYGADEESIEGLVGLTVGQARRSVASPFNIPTAAVAFVNGVPTEQACLLRCNDHLEFVLPHGRKAINRLLTKRQIEQEYSLTPHLLDELYRSVAPADTKDDGTDVYLESTVDDWMKERFADRLRKAQPADSSDSFMTTKDVAELLGCSYSEARERLLDGRIRAVKDGRWLRTRREWVEEYLARKTVQPAHQSEPGVVPVPHPPKRRSQATVKKGGFGHRFLERLSE